MYRCLVITWVGNGYDLNSSLIQTHSKAINLHKKFILSGAVDIDNKKRKLFEKIQKTNLLFNKINFSSNKS